MPQKNIEMVRWAYEEGMAHRRVDLPGVEERFAADYRFHMGAGFPGRTVYRLDELPTLWADLDATFGDHSVVPRRYEAIGPDFVLVALEQTVRLRDSDQRINLSVYQLWHVVDGRMAETWTFTEESDARAAAAPPT